MKVKLHIVKTDRQFILLYWGPTIFITILLLYGLFVREQSSKIQAAGLFALASLYAFVGLITVLYMRTATREVRP